jgi:hypothetical protein
MERESEREKEGKRERKRDRTRKKREREREKKKEGKRERERERKIWNEKYIEKDLDGERARVNFSRRESVCDSMSRAQECYRWNIEIMAELTLKGGEMTERERIGDSVFISARAG